MNDAFGDRTKKKGAHSYTAQDERRDEEEERLRLEQEARVNLFSANQSAYQETRQAVEDALVPPKPLEANEARTISAPLNSGPVNTSNIRNFSPLVPPANAQGNAKPLFEKEFEQKASMLAGSLDQANRVGY
tara:strand:- start:229 stop:624 length:396 start_codon:yes stop_codon:yes gene_type:complete